MNNVYIALDFPNWNKAEFFLKENDLHGAPVKVGMELFYREGVQIIHKLKENNHPIFLDLKLHDIPNTVMRAMKNIAQLDVDIVNVHALGGRHMLEQAKSGLIAGSNGRKTPKLIAVTVLTSFSDDTLRQDLHIDQQANEYAIQLAKLAHDSGVDGVVCSAHEANDIKQVCGEEFLTVTPGIRLESSTSDDQKRIATPTFAKQNGSNIIVVGRPITNAKNPKMAYEDILKEWNHE